MRSLLIELTFGSAWISDIVDVNIIASLATGYFKPGAIIRAMTVLVALAPKTMAWFETQRFRCWRRWTRSASWTERGPCVAVTDKDKDAWGLAPA